MQIRPDEEEEEASGLFSNSHTVLILTVVVGCFGLLWPKIFSPMFFGDPHDQRDSMSDLTEESLNSCEDDSPPVRRLINVLFLQLEEEEEEEEEDCSPTTPTPP